MTREYSIASQLMRRQWSVNFFFLRMQKARSGYFPVILCFKTTLTRSLAFLASSIHTGCCRIHHQLLEARRAQGRALLLGHHQMRHQQLRASVRGDGNLRFTDWSSISSGQRWDPEPLPALESGCSHRVLSPTKDGGVEQHRLGCEDEKTRSRTCFFFLLNIHNPLSF